MAKVILKAVSGDELGTSLLETVARSGCAGRLAEVVAGPTAERRATSRFHSERRRKTSTKSVAKGKPADTAEGGEQEQPSISRKELLEKALSVIANDLNQEVEKRPTNTIGNLVQLLKLDRSFREDEEQPHEIRVVWQEKRDETFDDSPESSFEN